VVRRAWVLGGLIGVAAVAFAATAGSSDDTSAKSVTTPPETNATLAAATIAVTTAPPTTVVPTTVLPTTTTSPSSTTTSIAPTTTSSTVPPTTTAAPTTTADLRPFDAAAFDAVIAAATVDVGDVSSGVAVIRDGQVLHAAAFGMENPLEGKPATAATRFRLGSVSKLLTSVAVMQLVEEGKIQLDQPFAAQLGRRGPFADPRVATITVRQLLSHMSGFNVSRNLYFGRGVETWQQAAETALGQTLQSDPGTAFRYSNTNFCILGLMIQRATGEPFETAIRERVLEPIGISAHLAPTIDTETGDAMHASSPGRNYMEALGPAGGWVATPTDVAKLAAALRNEAAAAGLDEDTVDSMRVPVPVPVETPPPVNGWSYGLGLMLFGDGSWGHTGTIESTHAVVVNRPDGLTVSILVSGKRPLNTDDLLPVIDLAVASAFAG
jgi:D-alanyl-D-alanine carboxypeptidase